MRARILPILASAAALWAPDGARAAGGAPATEIGTLVLQGATLLDGRGGAPTPETTIVLEGGRIREIRPYSALPRTERAGRILDLRGRYVIPGLVDAGATLVASGACSPNVGRGSAQIARNLRAALRDGVTSVADMGSGVGRAAALRDWTAAGPGRGPRVFPIGLISAFEGGGPGGYVDDGAAPPGVVSVARGPADVRAAVERIQRLGGEGVQALVAGRALDASPARETPEPVLRAIAREARIRGLRVLARANFGAGWRAALKAEPAALVQSPVDPLDEDMLVELRARNVTAVPALGALDALIAGSTSRIFVTRRLRERLSPDIVRDLRRFRRGWRHADHLGLAGRTYSRASLEAALEAAEANLRRLRAAGVRVAVGSDAGTCYNFHGAPLREMALLEKAGWSLPEILRAATLEAAAAIGFDGQIGTVEVGKAADLVVLREDPYASLAAYRTVEEVIAGGVLVEDPDAPAWGESLALAARLAAAAARPPWF